VVLGDDHGGLDQGLIEQLGRTVGVHDGRIMERLLNGCP
jgi:hypothetical protein